MKYTAIVLSAGSGSRMKSKMPKQYLPVLGRPLLYYTLQAFQESKIDEVILVTAPEYHDYCQKEIVEEYGFSKVRHIVDGGANRYDSVYEGLKKVRTRYVFIHDGARCMITPEMIARCIDAVMLCDAAVVGMPVKDTIKVADAEGYVKGTPDRSSLWQVQTPQCFRTQLITDAYTSYFAKGKSGATDDASILEEESSHAIRMVEGSYENIKATTPEDLIFIEAILRKRETVDKI